MTEPRGPVDPDALPPPQRRWRDIRFEVAAVFVSVEALGLGVAHWLDGYGAVSYTTAPRATGLGLLDMLVGTLGDSVQMQLAVLTFVTAVALMVTGLVGMVLLSRRLSSRLARRAERP